jgi:Tol biopolymer transport system component
LSTSNAMIARVEANGTVLGVAPGEAMLVVRAGQASTNVRVVVHGPISLDPEAGGGATNIAAGPDSGHSTRALVSVDPDMASTVHRVIVTPAPSQDPLSFSIGDFRRFHVQPLGADSLPAPVAVVWSLTDSSVAQFDRAAGVLRGMGVGTTDLVAVVPGTREIRWRVVVTALELTVTAGPIAVAIEEQHQLQAVMRDADGEVFKALEGGHWLSTNPAVITVDSSGLIKGIALGRADVLISSGAGDTARTEVFVVGDLLVSVSGGRENGVGIHQTPLGQNDTLSVVLADGSMNVYPSRSPDRTAIVFASDRDRGLYDLFVMTPDGAAVRQLTSSSGHHTQPAWASDREIVFTSTRTGVPQIFELSIDGGAARALTSGEEPSHSPAVSADGSTIAVVRGRGVAARIFLMDRDGQNVLPARLAEDGHWERAPRFLPNGDLAAVVQIGQRATAVFRWDRERDRRIPLLTSNDTIREFSISRDGRFLAVVIESSPRQGRKTELLVVDLTTRDSMPPSVPLASGKSITHVSF